LESSEGLSSATKQVTYRKKAYKKRAMRGPALWLAPAVAALAVFSILPFIMNIGLSFLEYDFISHSYVYVGSENWLTVIRDARVHNAIRVTFLYSVIALAVQFTLGLGIALLFNQKPIGIGLFQTVFMLPTVVPMIVVGLMFQLMQHSEFGVISYVVYSLGLISPEEPLLGGTGKFALLAVLLADIWQWTPFMTLILLAGLHSLPREPFEAAGVDGATLWQAFWFITLPLLKPVILVAVLIRTIDVYRVFDYIYILTYGGPGSRTETLSFYNYLQSFAYIKFGYGAAVGLVVLIVILIIANIYIRVFKVEW
jgi:multiple sugar transport system permease protein